MAMDEVTIYNMALNAVGTRNSVASPSEESREAEVCRLWFGPTRDQVLRAAPWPSAKAYARLAVLAERNDTLPWVASDPEPGFRFAYGFPQDLLAPRYLSSYGRFSTGTRGSVRALFSNEESVILFYTKSEPIIPLWDIALQMAVAHALAAYICLPLTGKTQRAKKAEDTANSLIYQAREQSANDDNDFLDTVPDWFTARGYAGSAPSVRYYYPYGPAIAFSDLPSVS